MDKESYTNLEVVVIEFENADVITESDELEGG